MPVAYHIVGGGWLYYMAVMGCGGWVDVVVIASQFPLKEG